MFEPTVDNTYHLMKDMLVKPSIYKDCIYTERAFNMGFSYRTILNIHKDFVIAQSSSRFRISITEYKYSVWVPTILKHNVYTVEKYA